MNTENIQKYLQTAYTDEKLAALLAHTQDNKLDYRSCCCLVGIATATHAFAQWLDAMDYHHYEEAMRLPFAVGAENEFNELGGSGNDRHRLRRERLMPLILAEMDRRAQQREVREEIEAHVKA